MAEQLHSGVYLLHFDRLGPSAGAHAQHYLGWSDDIEARLACHRNGRGSALVAAFVAAGIDFKVARIWPGMDRHGERRLKRRKNARKLCPICKGQPPWKL